MAIDLRQRCAAVDLDQEAVERLAYTAHEAHRAWRSACGDFFVPAWRDEDPDVKNAERAMVLDILERGHTPTRGQVMQGRYNLFCGVVFALDPRFKPQ